MPDQLRCRSYDHAPSIIHLVMDTPPYGYFISTREGGRRKEGGGGRRREEETSRRVTKPHAEPRRVANGQQESDPKRLSPLGTGWQPSGQESCAFPGCDSRPRFPSSWLGGGEHRSSTPGEGLALSSAQLSSAQLSSARLSSAQLSSAQLSLA